jgi:hypothetical protein
MKSSSKPSSARYLFFLATSFLFFSCQKQIDKPAQPEEVAASANNNSGHGHLKQTKEYSSDVAQKWLDMQVRNFRLPAGPNIGLNGHRYFGYAAIALYESVVPGMPAYQSLAGQLTDMPAMPSTEPGKAYHWPTCANAALAYMNKHFFSIDMTSMDSLENALNQEFQSDPDVDAAEFERSVNFGKTVAQRIFDWSKGDGASTVYPPYVPPVGPGLWAPTPPNFPAAVGPYWGNNRLMVPGSLDGTDSPAPPTYSTDPHSEYYKMVKEVYDVSLTLTPEQIALGLYFRDNPGYPASTHYLVIFNDIMHNEKPQLYFYALAMAKLGIVFNASFIGCWKLKYFYNQDRPIRYIREVLGHATWNALFNTPAIPDFPSGHSQNGGAFAAVMTSLLGDNYQFTLHTYDYLGMAPRTYNSFNEIAEDVGRSRVYAGIHYTYSCVEGKRQGEKIATNVLNILKFKKE